MHKIDKLVGRLNKKKKKEGEYKLLISEMKGEINTDAMDFKNNNRIL